jgi:hypothetical protein
MEPRLRGGFRQRLLAHARDALAPQPPELAAVPAGFGGGSHLCDCLLQLNAWGLLSAPTVQIIAAAAVADGLTGVAISTMAHAGTAGRHPQNVKRDLQLHFTGQIDLPPLYMFTVPCLSRRGEPVDVEMPVLLPHQLLSHISFRDPAVFAAFKLDGQLEAFWNECLAAGDPALHNHPVLLKPRWRARAMPLLVYGDGAAFSRNDSLEVVSCSALGHRGSTWRSRFVLAGLVKTAQIKGPGGSWDLIWQAQIQKSAVVWYGI